MKHLKLYEDFEAQGTVYPEIQKMIDENQFLKGKVQANKDTVYEAGESFRKNKHSRLVENITESGEVRLIFPGDKYTADIEVEIQDGKIVGDDIEGMVYSYDDTALSTCFDKFKKAGLTVLNKTDRFSREDADIVYRGWESRDGDDIEGEYTIKLEPLNKAIESGKVELVKDKDGDYEVIVK